MVNGERLFSLLGKMKRFLRNFFRALLGGSFVGFTWESRESSSLVISTRFFCVWLLVQKIVLIQLFRKKGVNDDFLFFFSFLILKVSLLLKKVYVH